jgi:hypothetical protein
MAAKAADREQSSFGEIGSAKKPAPEEVALIESTQVEKVFPRSIYVTYDPGAGWDETEGWNGGGDLQAWEYTG